MDDFIASFLFYIGNDMVSVWNRNKKNAPNSNIFPFQYSSHIHIHIYIYIYVKSPLLFSNCFIHISFTLGVKFQSVGNVICIFCSPIQTAHAQDMEWGQITQIWKAMQNSSSCFSHSRFLEKICWVLYS